MDSDTADTPPPVDPYGTDSDAGSDSQSDSSALLNALIGGGVGIVLSFIPGSTLLGGVVAGYLEDGDVESTLRVGSIAGVVMLVPLFLIWLVALTFLGLVDAAAFGGLIAAFFVGIGLYTVGLSVVGALVGRALKDEL